MGFNSGFKGLSVQYFVFFGGGGGVLSWLCRGKFTRRSHISNVSGGNLTCRGPHLTLELQVARVRFTAFFILPRDISVQSTTIKSLAFQQEKLTAPYLAVISTNRNYQLPCITDLRNDVNAHLH